MARLVAVGLLLAVLLHAAGEFRAAFLGSLRATTPALRSRVRLNADALITRKRVAPKHDDESDSGAYPPHGAFPVEVTLPGLFKEGASSEQELEVNWIYAIVNKQPLKFLPKLFQFLFSGRVGKTFKALNQKSIKALMHNARELEASEGLSKKDFFDKHGFVLLEHKSKMNAQDWVASGRNLANTTDIESQGEAWLHADTPCKQIWAKEAGELLKTIFPDAEEIITPAQGVRRGPPIDAKDYTDNTAGAVVHTDYGLSLDSLAEYPRFKFSEQVDKFRSKSNGNGYMLVNMWRPVLPMSKPNRWMPLAVLDYNTVSLDEMVSLRAYNDGKLDATSQFLKDTPNHKWYYYPDMTTDEVLVFKQVHCDKDEKSFMPTYHTAFKDPAATAGIERRCSFEYRVGVLL